MGLNVGDMRFLRQTGNERTHSHPRKPPVLEWASQTFDELVSPLSGESVTGYLHGNAVCKATFWFAACKQRREAFLRTSVQSLLRTLSEVGLVVCSHGLSDFFESHSTFPGCGKRQIQRPTCQGATSFYVRCRWWVRWDDGPQEVRQLHELGPIRVCDAGKVLKHLIPAAVVPDALLILEERTLRESVRMGVGLGHTTSLYEPGLFVCIAHCATV